MKHTSTRGNQSRGVLLAILCAVMVAAFPLPSLAQVFLNAGVTVGEPPPPIPIYEQPSVPAPDYIWSPGYWAWGPAGYFWVPGTWVLAPEPGYLWTPGYWAWNGNGYSWNPGYWAPAVGYYGGINYGGGYFGDGYEGGFWSGRHFRYNTYVTRVDEHIVRNVYINRNVFINRTAGHVSFSGGRGGVDARPTRSQLAVAHMRHLSMTELQRNHTALAAHDRRLFARVNHGRPHTLAVTRPLGEVRHGGGSVGAAMHAHAASMHAHAGGATHTHAAAPPREHAVTHQRAMTPFHQPAMQHEPVMRHESAVQHQAVMQHRPAMQQHEPVMRHESTMQHQAVMQHHAAMQREPRSVPNGHGSHTPPSRPHSGEGTRPKQPPGHTRAR